jgi:hypothetical protein
MDNAPPVQPPVEPQLGAPSVSGGGGALLRTVHAERTLMIYPIFESELRTISIFNALTAAGFSIGTGLLTFAGGLLIQTWQQDKPSPNAWKVVEIIDPILAVLAIVSYIFAIWAMKTRDSELNKIKKESKERLQ